MLILQYIFKNPSHKISKMIFFLLLTYAFKMFITKLFNQHPTTFYLSLCVLIFTWKLKWLLCVLKQWWNFGNNFLQNNIGVDTSCSLKILSITASFAYTMINTMISLLLFFHPSVCERKFSSTKLFHKIIKIQMIARNNDL